jgi:hypothetical protein
MYTSIVHPRLHCDCESCRLHQRIIQLTNHIRLLESYYKMIHGGGQSSDCLAYDCLQEAKMESFQLRKLYQRVIAAPPCQRNLFFVAKL